MVCLSNEELNEIKEGKPFPSYKFLPWILEFLGVPLMQRPPAPPVEVPEINPEELTEEERKAFEKEKKKKEIEEQKRLKEEAESLKAKEDRAIRRAAAVEAGMDLAEMGLEESEEEIKIDDLPIDQLTVAVDEDGNKPVIDRFILIGFPYTELHIEKLKEVGIGFDRIIYLNDLSEEDD
jgi:hypothetical protein